MDKIKYYNPISIKPDKRIKTMRTFLLGFAIGASAVAVYVASKLIDAKKKKDFCEGFE